MSEVENKVQKFLARKSISYDLSVQKLIDFYGLNRDKSNWEVVNIDDTEPLLRSQVGATYLYEPTRMKPTLLPPLDWWISAQSSEQTILEELREIFGEPTEVASVSNAIDRTWRDGLGSVRMTFFWAHANGGEESCTVNFNSGFRLPLKGREREALDRVAKTDPLALPSNVPIEISREIESLHLGILRNHAGFVGVGVESTTGYLVVGDGLQSAFIELKSIRAVRLILRRYRADYSSSLVVSYEDAFSPKESLREFPILGTGDHKSLKTTSEEFAKRIGQPLVVELDEQDY